MSTIESLHGLMTPRFDVKPDTPMKEVIESKRRKLKHHGDMPTFRAAVCTDSNNHTTYYEEVDDVLAGNNRAWTLYLEERNSLSTKYEALEARLQTTEDRLQITEGRLQTTEGRLQITEGRLQAVTDIVAPTFIRNIAAQLLLFIFGDQPRNDPETRRFRNLKKNDPRSKKIQKFANMLGSTTVGHFKKMSDEIINHRNNDVHFNDVQSLDAAVLKAMNMFNLQPSLMQGLGQQYYMLCNYEALKEAFEL